MGGKLYATQIRPTLEYALEVWLPHLRKHKDLIEKVQRSTTKMVLDYKEAELQGEAGGYSIAHGGRVRNEGRHY